MGNLCDVREMRYAFNSCGGLTEINYPGRFVILGGSCLRVRRMRVAHDNLCGRWLGVARLWRVGLSGVLPVHLAHGRSRYDLYEFACGLSVHEDWRRGRVQGTSR